MTGEIGALGELATGSLIAYSIDGPVTASGAVSHGACRNCGSSLHGHFCSHCGQHGIIHRSIAHIAEELLHGITHFDGKAWRTLPALVLRPGGLTHDYVHGKRARYIAPMALFLFTIFLMFFVFGMLGGPDINKALNGVNSPEAVADAREAVTEMRSNIADTEGELADPDTSGIQRQALTAALKAQRQALTAAEQKLNAPVAAKPAVAAAKVRWQDKLADAVRSGKIQPHGLSPAMTARMREALLNPDFALYRIQEKTYKLSFLLVPLSLPVLWLLFVGRRDVRAFDHIVFSLYSLSFMSLLVIMFTLLERAGSSFAMASRIAGLLLFVPPVHIFFQLKGAYRLGTGSALWRTAVLCVSSLMTLGIFAALIVVVGLAD